VCATAGYITSYWNRVFFPEACGGTMFDKVNYDTMVRISGSFVGVALVFKQVVDKYGWRHIVAVTTNVRRISVRGVNAALPPESEENFENLITSACPDCSQNITRT